MWAYMKHSAELTERSRGMKRIEISFRDGSKIDGIIGTGREIKRLWDGMDRRGFYHVFDRPTINLNRIYCLDLDGMDIMSESTIAIMTASDAVCGIRV